MHLKKYARHVEPFPEVGGENKKCLKPPPIAYGCFRKIEVPPKMDGL